jgi:hypothetical protein
MKSVTIRDCNGRILVKVLARKNGTHECMAAIDIADKIDVEIRDDQNKKVWLTEEVKK